MIRDDSERLGAKSHNLILEDRKSLSVTGVQEVESFDEQRIILHTSLGTLILRGTDLHIDKLSLETGELAVTGNIIELGYEETASAGGSFWSRLFK